MNTEIVSREKWLAARRALLAEEKALTHAREALSVKRRALPRVRIDKPYKFIGPDGPETLADLFDGRSQLIIYHFMYGADWSEGCPSCSFWADNYDGIGVHLAARDTTLVTVASAPLATLDAYRKRMGWRFKWVSASETDFNQDLKVSFTAEEVAAPAKNYNFGTQKFGATEAPGISVFYRDAKGTVFHTYSTFARGLDMMNGAYHYLDLTPKGRDEDGLKPSMAWLRRHDQYDRG